MAKSVDVYSPGGVVNVDVNQLTGPINVYGCEAHVRAATDVLYLGNIVLTGDPTFYNSLGDVVIGGDLSYPGQNLAIVANKNILTGVGAGAIDTGSLIAGTSGGRITLIAGANFTTTGPASGSDDTTSTLTILGASATGGKIDLDGGTPITQFRSGSNVSRGGNILLVAYAGSELDSGTVTIPAAVPVQSGGMGGGGDIRIIAGASSGTSIRTGALDSVTGGLPTGTGSISLFTATPVASAGTAILNGAIASGGFSAGSTRLASIATGRIQTPQNVVSIVAGDSFFCSDSIYVGQSSVSITTNSSSPFVIGGGVSPNGVANLLTANRGEGGGIFVTNNGVGGITVVSYDSLRHSTFGGFTANLTLNSPNGPLTLPSGTLSIGRVAGSNNGGTINLTGAEVLIAGGTSLALVANAGAPTSAGGQISLRATAATTAGDLVVSTSQISAVATGGATSGNGGTVTINAGGNLVVDPAAIDVTPIGANGRGGSINLTAGSVLQVNGSLTVNGAGTGNGGTINLTYSDMTLPLTVGSIGPGSYVSGSIQADAPGAGAGGTVAIFNAAPANLLVATSTLISATSLGGGAPGTIVLNQSGSVFSQGRIVNVSGSGTLRGGINSTAGALQITTEQTLAPLVFQNTYIYGAFLPLSQRGIRVTTPAPIVVQNMLTIFGRIVLNTPPLTNNGAITAQWNNESAPAIVISAPATLTVQGNGIITSREGNYNTIAFTTPSGSASNTITFGGSQLLRSDNTYSLDGGPRVIIASGAVSFNPGTVTNAIGVNDLTTDGIYGITVLGDLNAPVVNLNSAGDITVAGNVTASGGPFNLNANVNCAGCTTPGILTISGTVNGSSGSFLGAPLGLNITGMVNVGSGLLNIRGNGVDNFHLNLEDLVGRSTAQYYSYSEISTGTAGLTIVSNCVSCSSKNSFSFTSNGPVSAQSAVIALSPTAVLSMQSLSGDLNPGTINGGSDLSFNFADALTLDGGINAPLATVNMVGSGVASLSGPLTAANILLTASSLILNENVSATGTATLRSTGSGTISQSGGLVSADRLVLLSDQGSIGLSTRSISIDANRLTINVGDLANFMNDSYVHDINDLEVESSFAGDTLVVSAQGDLNVTGEVSGATLLLRSVGGNLTLSADVRRSDITLQVSSQNVIAQTAGTIFSSNSLTIIGGQSTTLNTDIDSLYASATGDIAINNATALTLRTIASGNLLVNATSVAIDGAVATNGSLTVISAGTFSMNAGARIESGTLAAGAAPSGVLGWGDLSIAGAILVQAADLNISSSLLNPTTLVSNGGNIHLIAVSGNAVLTGAGPGDGGLSLHANGGHIQVLAAGNVTAKSNNNSFIARSMGQPDNFIGGGIEIGAGLTSSNAITDYFASRDFTFSMTTVNLGPNIVVNNHGQSGIIEANITGSGFINVGSPSPLSPTIMNVAGGALFFHALNGTFIDMDPSFISNSFAIPSPPVPPFIDIALPAIIANSTLPSVSTVTSNSAPLVSSTILSTDTLTEVASVSAYSSETEPESQQLEYRSDSQQQVVSTSSCQPYLGSGDSLVMAESGTVFSSGQGEKGAKQLKLDQGKVLVTAGSTAVVIVGRMGRVMVLDHSAALVEQTQQGNMRLVSLSGKPANVTVEGGEAASLAAGEEMALWQGDDEELIPADGVPRVAVSGKILATGVKMQKNRLDVTSLVRSDQLLKCISGASSRFRVPRSKASTSQSRNPLLPIAHSTPMMHEKEFNSIEVGDAFCISDGASVNVAKGRIQFSSGEALIAARRKVCLDVEACSVQLKQGAVVLVSCRDGLAKIRSLTDNSSGSVRCIVNSKKHLDIAPGQEFAFGQSRKVLFSDLKADKVARRRMRTAAIEEIHVVTAEFSPLGLLVEHPILRFAAGRKSNFYNRLLKTALCLSVATSSHGPYAPLD